MERMMWKRIRVVKKEAAKSLSERYSGFMLPSARMNVGSSIAAQRQKIWVQDCLMATWTMRTYTV